jgi:hypothetical protein
MIYQRGQAYSSNCGNRVCPLTVTRRNRAPISIIRQYIQPQQTPGQAEGRALYLRPEERGFTAHLINRTDSSDFYSNNEPVPRTVYSFPGSLIELLFKVLTNAEPRLLFFCHIPSITLKNKKLNIKMAQDTIDDYATTLWCCSMS